MNFPSPRWGGPAAWHHVYQPAAAGGQGCKDGTMESLGRMDRWKMLDVLLQLRKFHKLFERRWRSSVLGVSG